MVFNSLQTIELYNILYLFKVDTLVCNVVLINITFMTNKVATREIIEIIGVLFNLIYGLKYARGEH